MNYHMGAGLVKLQQGFCSICAYQGRGLLRVCAFLLCSSFSFFIISFFNIVLIITTYSHNCPPSNCQLTSHGVCFRTEVAACIKYMTRTDWQNHILGISTRGVDTMRTNAIIRGWIVTYLQEADEMIALLEKMRTTREENTHMDGELVGNENGGTTDNGRLEMLLIRWYQIRKLCEDAVQALGE